MTEHDPLAERAKRDEASSGSVTGAVSELLEGLAPVIPLFDRSQPVEQGWDSTWIAEPSAVEGDAERIARAEAVLLRRLRARALSVDEARDAARTEGLTPDESMAIVVRFVDLGYLDDAALAEQLVHVGVDRKHQGRQVVARTLAQRGIPRDVADHALAALPDDDAEKALEFARTKARSLRGVEPHAALRRLVGQLSRRGYPGSVAMTAAKQALTE